MESTIETVTLILITYLNTSLSQRELHNDKQIQLIFFRAFQVQSNLKCIHTHQNSILKAPILYFATSNNITAKCKAGKYIKAPGILIYGNYKSICVK